jgi:ATP-dependent DNA helicase PIF1
VLLCCSGKPSRRSYITRLGIKFCKATFPLQLAYAMTAHKAQGATINGPCLIDLHSAFQRGMAYTMLSRVRSRQQLALVRDLLPSDIVPVLIPGL